CSASAPPTSPRSLPATMPAPPRDSTLARRRTKTKKLLDAMPVAYAITYIFGTMGSPILIGLLGPALLRFDLEAACRRYEEEHGGKKQTGGPGTAWHQLELRAVRVCEGGRVAGRTVQAAGA